MSDLFHQEVIIFDPASSALIEERTIWHLPYGDQLPPILWGRATYLESAIVPELPAD